MNSSTKLMIHVPHDISDEVRRVLERQNSLADQAIHPVPNKDVEGLKSPTMDVINLIASVSSIVSLGLAIWKELCEINEERRQARRVSLYLSKIHRGKEEIERAELDPRTPESIIRERLIMLSDWYSQQGQGGADQQGRNAGEPTKA